MDDLLLSLHNDNRTYFSKIPLEICNIIFEHFRCKVVGITTNGDLDRICKFLQENLTYTVINKNAVVSFKYTILEYHPNECIISDNDSDKRMTVFATENVGGFWSVPSDIHLFMSDYEIQLKFDYNPPKSIT